MSTFIAGTTATLTVEWQQYPGGPDTDVNNLTFAVDTIDGHVVIATTSAGIVHVATGLYSYDWAIPANEAAGTYVAVWNATNAASAAISASEQFGVSSPPGTGAWCTVADVLAIANATVAPADVTVAQIIIETFVHRVWRLTDADKRDNIWLKRGVAFQAAYVNQHPEIITMMGVQSLGQDGMSLTFPQAAKAYLAPLAILALNNVFRGSNGTVRLNSAFQKNRLRRVGYGLGATVPWGNI